MDATVLSSSTTSIFIDRLSKDYPDFSFEPGDQEHWSPETLTVFFSPDRPCYGVLHELAHALLNHSSYNTDFELLKLESDAWELAIKIGKKYGISIDEDHVQNCLDTYRDWLHKRSTCPSCGTHVLQKNSNNYSCFNCQTTWQVTSGRFVRPYRKIVKEKTTP
jgi:hypothetical protein